MISIRLTIDQLNSSVKEIAHKKGLLVEQYLRLLVLNAITLNNEVLKNNEWDLQAKQQEKQEAQSEK